MGYGKQGQTCWLFGDGGALVIVVTDGAGVMILVGIGKTKPAP